MTEEKNQKDKQENKNVLQNTMIIDADSAILGRLASYTAKQLLLGKKVVIVNCEKAVVSGNRKNILENYLTMRKFKKVKFPSQAEQILKRTVRGMLSYKMGRGEHAFKNLRCYNKIPDEFEKEKKIKSATEKKDLMSLGEISNMLKYKK